MAKDKKMDVSKDGCTRVRTSIGLPSEWMHVFQHLSTSRSKDLGELVQGFLEREFATLPRAESEAIRTLVRLATGKTLRLSGACGPAVVESVPPDLGQGSSATGSDMLANRLADIQTRAVDAPIGDALASLYGN